MSTVIIRPNGAGDRTECGEYPTSTFNWDKVDEVVTDEDSTYVDAEGDPDYYYDFYNMPDGQVPSNATISSITVTGRYRRSSFPSTYGTNAMNRIKIGGVEYDGITRVPISTYANYSDTWTTNPYTGVAWTPTDIDNLQVGLMCRYVYQEPDHFSLARCTQLYVTIPYTLPPTIQGIQTIQGISTIQF